MTFLLALALLAAPARAADKIVFRADPRLEAVGSAELALKNRARGFTDPKDEYSKKVLERLKPFADHPALKLQAAFPKAFTFADRCDIADRLTLDLRSTTSYFLPDPVPGYTREGVTPHPVAGTRRSELRCPAWS